MTELVRTPAPTPLALLQRVRGAWLRAAAAVVCWWLVAPAGLLAQDPGLAASAPTVKAAYLLKLPAYVDWPTQRFARSDSALIVGLLGADDVAEVLSTLAVGRTVSGRPVVVRALRPDDELQGVHVLYFRDAPRERADEIAAEAAAQNILTVTDVESGAQDSVIAFVSANGKLRFDVRLDSAERNGLRLHAGLLNVAARVRGAGR